VRRCFALGSLSGCRESGELSERGGRIVNVDPTPSSLSTVTVPWWASAMVLTVNKPNPPSVLSVGRPADAKFYQDRTLQIAAIPSLQPLVPRANGWRF
jgi:hypothetical protein